MPAGKFSARTARYALGRAATKLVPRLGARMPFYDDVLPFVDVGAVEIVKEKQDISLEPAQTRFAKRLRPEDQLPKSIERSIALVRLASPTVLGNTGAIIDAQRQVLLKPRGGPSVAGHHDFRAEPTMLVRKPEANYFHMVGEHRGHRHFFHFLLERLPRLYYLLERFSMGRGQIVVLTNQDLPQYQREIYGFLAARNPNLRFEAIPRAERWQLPTLFVIDDFQPVKRTLASMQVLDFVRGLIFDGYGLAPSGKKHRLYVTRSDAKKRRIGNEAELVPILEARGFEIVAPGTLSFRDQVALFMWTDAVVGPHGAGMTNILFAPKSNRVLEIFPANKVKNTYLLLAHSLGQSYGGLVGGAGGKREWFRVDPAEFTAALDGLLA